MGELLAVKDRFYGVLIDGADSAVLATMLSSLQARLCAEHVRNACRTGLAELEREGSAVLA